MSCKVVRIIYGDSIYYSTAVQERTYKDVMNARAHIYIYITQCVGIIVNAY